MFAKLSPLATLALVPWVNALLLELPQNWHSSSVVNISWTNQPTDPSFSLQLTNNIFHDTFAIANNLNPSADFASFELGVVPSPSKYTLRAINVTNTGIVFDETPEFTIDAPVNATTTSSSSSTSASSSSSSTGTGGSTATSNASSSSSSTPFGSTVSNTNSAATSSSTGSSTGSSSSSAQTSAGGGFGNGNGAAPGSRAASYLVVALGLVAGAAVAL